MPRTWRLLPSRTPASGASASSGPAWWTRGWTSPTCTCTSAGPSCTLRQRTRPVLNDHGIAAQGSLGAAPSIYRRCTFERVRFKTRGGFGLGQARFEECRFVDCRWEGSFAYSADLVDCVFSGRMNGCVWFGRDGERVNEIHGNDLTGVDFTRNVGWRADFPFAEQTWPEGYLRSRGV